MTEMAFDPADRPSEKIGKDLDRLESSVPELVPEVRSEARLSVRSDDQLRSQYGSATTDAALQSVITGRPAVIAPRHHQGRWSASAFGDRLMVASSSSVVLTAVVSDWFSGSAAGVMRFILIATVLLMVVLTVAPIPMSWYPHLFHRGARKQIKPDPAVLSEVNRVKSSSAVHRHRELVEAVRITAAAQYLSSSPSWNSDLLAPQSAMVNHHQMYDDIISSLSDAVSVRVRADRDLAVTGDDAIHRDRMDRINRSLDGISRRVDVMEMIVSEVYRIDGYQRQMDSLHAADQLDRDIIDAEVRSELGAGLNGAALDRVEELEAVRSAMSEMVETVSRQAKLL